MSPDAQPDARIYDQGYRPFEGELASPRSRFLVIAFNELRLAWRNKWFKRWIIASFVPLIVFAVLVVVRSRFSFVFQNVMSKFWESQIFFSVVIVYFTGRNAVGEDLRTGAMAVYFSRPVSFIQYLAGKWLAMAVGVLFVTLLPGLVLAVFRWLVESQAGTLDFLGWLAGLLALSILLCVTLGGVMLAISSLTPRGRTAGVVWLVVYIALILVAEGLANATAYSELNAVSFSRGSLKLSEFLLDGDGSFLEAVWYALGQLAWIALSFTVVFLRLRRWVRY
jgi:ABC-type transport system involved in multi-copper enzyme maturation permease subunit